MTEFLKLVFAFIWGAAEAIFFFIVPDVLLSRYALDDLRFAIKASFLALFGALFGGYLLFELSRTSSINFENFLLRIPAINPSMMDKARSDLSDYGIYSLIVGSFSGRPYKIYTVLLSKESVSIVSFLFVSVFARLLRFLAVVTIVRLIGQKIRPRQLKIAIFYSGWILFYFFYFKLNS